MNHSVIQGLFNVSKLGSLKEYGIWHYFSILQGTVFF